MMLNRKNSIEIAKLISLNYVKKEEILKELKIKGSTFHKQIALLKKAGFKISRKKDSYKLMVFKNVFELKNFETSVLAYLLSLSCVSMSAKKINEFIEIIEKILYLADEKSYLETIEKFNYLKGIFLKDFYSEKLKVIQKYIEKKHTLKVTLTSKNEFLLKPTHLEFGKEKIYIIFLDVKNKETKRISVEKIVKITPLDFDLKTLSEKRETIFELYGSLAKTYLLKEEERVIDITKNKLVIANYDQDKKLLFQRLLRYDILCKVILPKKDAQNFQNLIEQSIENILSKEQ